MRWIIDNGRNILFWEDCWLGEKPLAFSSSLRRLQEAAKCFFRERVSYYFINNTWRALVDCYIDQPLLLFAARELQELLAGTLLPFFLREDKFIWKWDPSRDFSVRTAYNNLLRELDHTINWNAVWNPQLIPPPSNTSPAFLFLNAPGSVVDVWGSTFPPCLAWGPRLPRSMLLLFGRRPLSRFLMHLVLHPPPRFPDCGSCCCRLSGFWGNDLAAYR
ncbi:hypothetical protein SUGI_1081100 [Cryptomeria japonica]|nr:hypothetical protein SUGI_1081100 [Cryptomeria japonica]